jgi:hypothetical protein
VSVLSRAAVSAFVKCARAVARTTPTRNTFDYWAASGDLAQHWLTQHPAAQPWEEAQFDPPEAGERFSVTGDRVAGKRRIYPKRPEDTGVSPAAVVWREPGPLRGSDTWHARVWPLAYEGEYPGSTQRAFCSESAAMFWADTQLYDSHNLEDADMQAVLDDLVPPDAVRPDP